MAQLARYAGLGAEPVIRGGGGRAGGRGGGTMGSAGEDLLVTLQILPGFFSNCLFLALYDSVLLLRRAAALLRCQRSAACGGGGAPRWRRMLTSAGLRAVWNSFLLDAYKQVRSVRSPRGPNPRPAAPHVPRSRASTKV